LHPAIQAVPLTEAGLDLSGEWQVRGTDDWKIMDNEFHFSLEIPAMGMRLIEISPG